MDKSFDDFERDFPEFFRVFPSCLIAIFALDENPENEIVINIETSEIRSLGKIPIKYYFRLINFAKKHNFKLNIDFKESIMEKTGNNKLAELYLAKEQLKKKDLEKTASSKDKENLELIEKEIQKVESKQ